MKEFHVTHSFYRTTFIYTLIHSLNRKLSSPSCFSIMADPNSNKSVPKSISAGYLVIQWRVYIYHDSKVQSHEKNHAWMNKWIEYVLLFCSHWLDDGTSRWGKGEGEKGESGKISRLRDQTEGARFTFSPSVSSNSRLKKKRQSE